MESSPSAQLERSVHPRVRGERALCLPYAVAPIGSSPRPRGTYYLVRWTDTHKRFIPASAGNVRPPRSRPRPPAVHPRVRGERYHLSWRELINGGSSPRPRGTCRALSARPQGSRFIPASAGNVLQGLFSLVHRTVHPRVRGERTKSFPVDFKQDTEIEKSYQRGTSLFKAEKTRCISIFQNVKEQGLLNVSKDDMPLHSICLFQQRARRNSLFGRFQNDFRTCKGIRRRIMMLKGNTKVSANIGQFCRPYSPHPS